MHDKSIRMCLYLLGKPDLSSNLRELEITCLQEHSEVLHNELDPLYLCDLLFEERAITILAHDKITEVKQRQKQIKYLLRTVVENENNCFHFFLYILQREDYKHIREKLEKSAPRAENAGMFISFKSTNMFYSSSTYCGIIYSLLGGGGFCGLF